MKVKNIAFTGFAAAILAGVGAADAAQQLVTPNYVSKALEGVDGRVTTLETTMGEGTLSTDAKTIVGAINELDTIANGLPTNENFNNMNTAINNIKDSIGTVPEGSTVVGMIEAAEYDDTELAGRVDTLEKAGYQNQSQVEALIGTATTGMATESYVTNAIAGKADTATVNEALGLKADKTELAGYATTGALEAVKTTADNAAAKTYVDEELAKKADASALSGYATTGALEAVKTTADNAAAKTYVDEELAKKANAGTTYSKTEVDNLFVEKAYDDTAVRGLITENANDIAENAGNITKNSGNITLNTNAITALQANSIVSGPTADGMYLVTKSGETTTWTQVEILDNLPEQP